MIIPGFGDVKVTFPTNHVESCLGRPKGYPRRLRVIGHDTVAWDALSPDYLERRPNYTAPIVLKNFPNSWAHSPNIAEVPRGEISSFIGKPCFNKAGYPLNPVGLTGLGERGLLGKWGANEAADPVVTCLTPDIDILLLAILRSDSDRIALPGGMVNPGELFYQTADRELNEETSVSGIDMAQGKVVYRGYIDDPRNTDHAWMEATAVHRHIDYEHAMSLTICAADDASDAFWLKLTPELLHKGLYADHAMVVGLALMQLACDNEKAALAVADLLGHWPK